MDGNTFTLTKEVKMDLSFEEHCTCASRHLQKLVKIGRMLETVNKYPPNSDSETTRALLAAAATAELEALNYEHIPAIQEEDPVLGLAVLQELVVQLRRMKSLTESRPNPHAN